MKSRDWSHVLDFPDDEHVEGPVGSVGQIDVHGT
jgi:hypothetical protein